MPVSPVWEDPRVSRAMRAQLERRRARLADGERSIGWKMVFNHASARERYDIESPLVAFMTDALTLESGATVPSLAWTKPGLEPEIVVHIGQDLPGGSGLAGARAAIAGLGAGIEIIDVDDPSHELEHVVAGGAFFRSAVLGPVDTSRAGGIVDGIHVRAVHNGAEVARTEDPAAVLGGDLPSLISHVSDLLAAFGEMLRSGDVILSGALTAPIFPQAGDEAEFDMGPLGPLSVRLQAAA
jgi:2-keto-4-pentenoate hydratase